MAKFKNRYGVRKIVYKQKCRCFCPIGKADYTNEFTVTMEVHPSWIMVESAVNDAPHGNVVVMV